MFALVERKLRQIERRRAIGPSSREVRLIIAQTVADAVSIGAVRVSLDVTQSCIRHASIEQMMDELQQRPSGHAQTTTLVALFEEGANRLQRALAVGVHVQWTRQREHGKPARNGL